MKTQFADGAELQAYLDQLKTPPPKRELVMTFSINHLMKMRYADKKHADTYIIESLIKQGAPIKWKAGAPPSDRDCEDDDLIVSGEMTYHAEHDNFQVTGRW